MDAEPDVEGLGIEGFELAGDALVHGAAIDLDVGRALVDRVREDLVEIAAAQVLAHGDDLVGAAVEIGEVVVAIEKDDGVGGRVEELLHLPAERFGLEIGTRSEVWHKASLAMPGEVVAKVGGSRILSDSICLRREWQALGCVKSRPRAADLDSHRAMEGAV